MTSAPTYPRHPNKPSIRISLSVPMMLSAYGHAAEDLKASVRRPQQILKIFRDCADASIVHLASRALNDFHSTFGNLFPYVDTKGYAHQVSVLELHSWPFVPVVQ